MKRIFITLLALLLALTCALSLVGCGNGDSRKKEKDSDEVDEGKAAKTTSGDEVTDGPGFDGYKADSLCFTGFSEGKALFKVSGTQKIRCVDPYGNLLFEVDFGDSYISDVVEFHNGVSIVGFENGTAAVIDENGKILDPSIVGGDSFVFREVYTYGDICPKMFRDGYLIVQKVTTNYQGSTTEFAIVNHKMEKLVDYSKELFEVLGGNWKNSYYINGYFIEGQYNWQALNLKTGELHDGYSSIGELLDLLNIDYRGSSELWEASPYGYKTLSNDLILDLSEYSKTLNGCSAFKDGLAMITFRVSESSSVKYYATIIDEKGNFLFEPIDITDNTKKESMISTLFIHNVGNGEFLLQSSSHWVTFDKNGKIAELEFTDFFPGESLDHVKYGEGLFVALEKSYRENNIVCYTFDLVKR